MILISVGNLGPNAFAVMYIFALGIFHFAYFALSVKLTHFIWSRHIAIVLTVRVYHTGFLNSLNKLHRFLHGLNGKHL